MRVSKQFRGFPKVYGGGGGIIAAVSTLSLNGLYLQWCRYGNTHLLITIVFARPKYN